MRASRGVVLSWVVFFCLSWVGAFFLGARLHSSSDSQNPALGEFSFGDDLNLMAQHFGIEKDDILETSEVFLKEYPEEIRGSLPIYVFSRNVVKNKSATTVEISYEFNRNKNLTGVIIHERSYDPNSGQ